MTFEELARSYMHERCMFPEQIDAVIANLKAAPENKSMEHRWSDQVEGYPPPMKAVLWFTVRTHALEYIDKECPKAWFRPLFETETSQQEA